jgi:predicted permease
MAQAFDSTPKKLAIPLFGLFFIGLSMFTAGFGLLLKSNTEEDDELKEDSNRKSPLYFPYYMTLVGGIFVALLELLHAALPSGTPSSIIGALSIPSTLFQLGM